MKRHTNAVLAGVLGALQVASAQVGPRVRDSSGIRIVENAARASAPVRFALSEKPVVDVGGLEDDPAKEFNHRNGLLRGVTLATGGLAVIDANRVHFFDAAGKRKLISGREGSGPGEFLYLSSICRARGDTVVVSDNRNRRVTILEGNGAFVRVIPQVDGASPPFNGCLNDGTFLLSRIDRIPGPNNTFSSVRYVVTRVRLDGSFVDSVGTFDFGGSDPTSGRSPVVFAGADRMGFADGHGDIYVRTFTPPVRMIVRSADPVIPISGAEREERMRMTIPNNVSADELRQRMERLRQLSSDKSWPSHRAVHLDDDGRLWVQDFNPDYIGAHGWTAYDRSGRPIGRLMMPAVKRRFDIIGFGKDQVIVMRADEDDAKHISVYTLKPAPGR